jgi:hypothetical protein
MEYRYIIGIRNKTPYLISGPPGIVADNNDYFLTLEPDAEWDGLETKTVYYAFDDGTSVKHIITGNEDAFPLVRTKGHVYVGVSAGDTKTTRALAIPIFASIRQKEGVEIPEPEPGVYDVILEMLSGHEVRIKRLEAGGTGGGGGIAFVPGHALELTEDGTLNVRTTNEAEADNTLPITSAGVNTIVGNIGALLDTI